ncbi:SIR2 family protein [Nannocystis bainbridge]|uniref:SIR2-like domain-containing protein n=1 Tax=Nannocystis bainbridge TaxID=2995303 RepID=A0ABT5DU35_9BACT|nr:SIR2 family protein [Nannocystis bainbridge]MDC0717066.1 hypothetical protein [Nannocystis bainbridge]
MSVVEPEVWGPEGLCEQFWDVDRKMHNRRFAFILGAGASVQSGIPTAGTLVRRWLGELHRRLARADVPLERWATAEALEIAGFSFADLPASYSQVFARRFRQHPDEGYADLEDIMQGKDPSFGYSVLAHILAETRHKLVITTNFDNLVGDALSIFTGTTPLVCGHESLANFVHVEPRRPVVVKIHRDLLMAPMNQAAEIAALQTAWIDPLTRVFRAYTPIVIGYGGNDGSLMGFLNSLPEDAIPGGIFWCYYGPSGPPSPEIRRLVARHRGVLVPVEGFDELMLRLSARLRIPLLDQVIESKARTRVDNYRRRVEELQARLFPSTPAEAEAIEQRTGGPASAEPASPRSVPSDSITPIVAPPEASPQPAPAERSAAPLSDAGEARRPSSSPIPSDSSPPRRSPSGGNAATSPSGSPVRSHQAPLARPSSRDASAPSRSGLPVLADSPSPAPSDLSPTGKSASSRSPSPELRSAPSDLSPAEEPGLSDMPPLAPQHVSSDMSQSPSARPSPPLNRAPASPESPTARSGPSAAGSAPTRGLEVAHSRPSPLLSTSAFVLRLDGIDRPAEPHESETSHERGLDSLGAMSPPSQVDASREDDLGLNAASDEEAESEDRQRDPSDDRAAYLEDVLLDMSSRRHESLDDADEPVSFAAAPRSWTAGPLRRLPAAAGSLQRALQQVAGEAAAADPWTISLQARAEPDRERAIALLRAGLQQFPADRTLSLDLVERLTERPTTEAVQSAMSTIAARLAADPGDKLALAHRVLLLAWLGLYPAAGEALRRLGDAVAGSDAIAVEIAGLAFLDGLLLRLQGADDDSALAPFQVHVHGMSPIVGLPHALIVALAGRLDPASRRLYLHLSDRLAGRLSAEEFARREPRLAGSPVARV